jgi:hypothetical protein
MLFALRFTSRNNRGTIKKTFTGKEENIKWILLSAKAN